MKKIFLTAAATLVAALWITLAAQQQPAATKKMPADSLQQKIDHMRANAAKPTPDPKPTVFTDEEVDAYMASGRVAIPAGISNIHVKTQPAFATATGRVNFDELLKERRSMNPLWGLFSGTHDVRALVAAEGHGGTATLHVQEVDFDGQQVPRFALQFFLDHYLKPKVPNAGLDTTFKMPARIDSATLGNGKTTFIQK
jgi:hypothetical protein